MASRTRQSELGSAWDHQAQELLGFEIATREMSPAKKLGISERNFLRALLLHTLESGTINEHYENYLDALKGVSINENDIEDKIAMTVFQVATHFIENQNFQRAQELLFSFGFAIDQSLEKESPRKEILDIFSNTIIDLAEHHLGNEQPFDAIALINRFPFGSSNPTEAQTDLVFETLDRCLEEVGRRSDHEAVATDFSKIAERFKDADAFNTEYGKDLLDKVSKFARAHRVLATLTGTSPIGVEGP